MNNLKYISILIFLNFFLPVHAQDIVLSTCDVQSEWIGGTIDNTVFKEGEGSVRWEHSLKDKLSLNINYNIDLSSCKYITFWIYSKEINDNGYVLLLTSDESDWSNYYYTNLLNDYKGWKQIILRTDQFYISRTPQGWNTITDIYFTCSGWGNTPTSQIVYIDDLRATNEIPAGPLMSLPDFFNLLDYSIPDLKPVKVAVENSDYLKATSELADYYRNRTWVPWKYNPHDYSSDRSPYTEVIAEDALSGKVTIIDIPYTFPDKNIDWFYNVTNENKDYSENVEWQYQLNRQDMLYQLAMAYWTTQDEEYAVACVKYLRDWIKDCPRPSLSGNLPVSAWRTLETGIRLSQVWPEIFNRLLHSPNFTDEDILYFLISLTEQAEYLNTYQTSGNWIFHELGGLYTTACLFPEINESSAWRKKAITLLEDELEKQFLPDGSHIDFSSSYHKISLDYIFEIYELALLFNRTNELSGEFLNNLEKSVEFQLKTVTPKGTPPLFQDCEEFYIANFFSDKLKYYPDKPDFEWAATGKGFPPDYTSVLNDYSGYCIMRNDWTSTSNYLAFDAGMFGYGHVHFDKLNLILYAYGQELLYDDGGGEYENSIWRNYSESSFAHNTINIDSKSQYFDLDNRMLKVPSSPVPLDWISNERFDYAAAEYSGAYGSANDSIAIHSREIIFIKPDLFVVLDKVFPRDNEPHTYVARWQLNTKQIDNDESYNMISSDIPESPNLSIIAVPVNDVEVNSFSGEESDEIQNIYGWKVIKGSDRVETTTVTHVIEGTGNKTFLTILKPLNTNEKYEVSEVEIVSDTVARISLSDHSYYRIIFKKDAQKGMRIEFFDPEGNLDRIVDSDKPELTGLPDTTDSGMIDVYPQPSKGIIKILSKKEFNSIKVFDSKGVLAFQNNSKNFSTELDMSNLNPGFYFLQVTGENINHTKKILLIR